LRKKLKKCAERVAARSDAPAEMPAHAQDAEAHVDDRHFAFFVVFTENFSLRNQRHRLASKQAGAHFLNKHKNFI